jgi:hypothetical protein
MIERRKDEMKKILNKRVLLVVAAMFALSAIGAAQIQQVLKIFGVGAVVQQFGREINNAFNSMTSHRDSSTTATKVVPIISGGIGSRNAVGAAQVMGPRSQVDKVQAVAQLEQDLFGREVRIRAMIPISTREIGSNISRVDGVGVSGIVDLKL